MSLRLSIAIALAASSVSARADADTFQQCGLTRVHCASAETQVRVQSADGVNFNDRSLWVYPQRWTPWEIVLATDGGLRIRYKLGGFSMWDGKGSQPSSNLVWQAPPDNDWTTHEYRVASCSGSVGSKKALLHVPPAQDITLLFDDNGAIVEVQDPSSMNHSNQLVMRTVTLAGDKIEGGQVSWKDYYFHEARNASWLCPGQAAAPAGGAMPGRTTAPGAPGAPAAATPAAGGVTFEKAPATTGGSNRRDSTTGEQGGAGGAKEVFFKTLDEQRAKCESGVAEACRAAGIMLRHEGKRGESRKYLDRACKGGSQTACEQLKH